MMHTLFKTAATAKKKKPLRRPKISEFVVTAKEVPLPRFNMRRYPQKFNYDDLPEIRRQVWNTHFLYVWPETPVFPPEPFSTGSLYVCAVRLDIENLVKSPLI